MQACKVLVLVALATSLLAGVQAEDLSCGLCLSAAREFRTEALELADGFKFSCLVLSPAKRAYECMSKIKVVLSGIATKTNQRVCQQLGCCPERQSFPGELAYPICMATVQASRNNKTELAENLKLPCMLLEDENSNVECVRRIPGTLSVESLSEQQVCDRLGIPKTSPSRSCPMCQGIVKFLRYDEALLKSGLKFACHAIAEPNIERQCRDKISVAARDIATMTEPQVCQMLACCVNAD